MWMRTFSRSWPRWMLRRHLLRAPRRRAFQSTARDMADVLVRKTTPFSHVPRAERCFPKAGSGETQENVTEKDALGWNRQRRPEILRCKRRRASVYLWRAAWRRWPGRASIQLSARHAKKPRDDKAASSVVPAPFKMSGESLSPNVCSFACIPICLPGT